MATSAYLGAIFMFGGTFAPVNYALCNGQIMSINSNSALFAIIGTTYGGNGQTTFGLPDLRGRVPLHTGGGSGTGPGLSTYDLGEETGTEGVQLTIGELPSHNHALNANATQSSDLASGTFLASGGAYALTANSQLASQAIGSIGSNQAHPNLQPLLAVNFIICVNGAFPSRN